MTDLPHTSAWLGAGFPSVPKFDRTAADTMAEMIMDGVNAIGGPEKAAEKMLVLRRCLAMVIAGSMQGNTDEALQAMCDELAQGLGTEALLFRTAVFADLRKAG